MSEWKKIALKDAVNKIVFHDKVGFIKYSSVYFCVNDIDLNSGKIFRKNSKGEFVEFKIGCNDVKKLKQLFDTKTKLYVKNNSYYYYNSSQYKELIVEKIYIIPAVPKKKLVIEITKDNLDKLEYWDYVWIKESEELDTIQEVEKKYFQKFSIHDLKVGDNIFIPNRGKAKIKHIYLQPNYYKYMCDAVFEQSEEVFKVQFSENVYFLPNEQKKIIQEVTYNFDENKNELSLSPYVVWENNCINVYWFKLYEAANYIISLYKKSPGQPYMPKVAHLKDVVIDRNCGYVVFDKLVGSGYIIKVKAESREGEIIAESRAILVQSNGNSSCCYPSEIKESIYGK